MNSIFKSLAFSGSLAAHTAALPAANAPRGDFNNCQEVAFKVSGTAMNREILVQPDVSDFDHFVGFLTQNESYVEVRGQETIVGRYCRPTIVNIQESEESKTLQLLVHGNTYDSTYFQGLGHTDYSWEAFANDRGYPTLAIDRLGSGKSSHPDGARLVQAPYQVELIHKLIAKLRGGPGIGLPNSSPSPGVIAPFDRLVWVGHSYGSIIGNQLAAKYPRDIDAYLLTGIAIPKPADFALPGQWAMGFQVAHEHDPVRFPLHDKAYFVTSSRAGRMATFYSDPARDFDMSAYDTDFDTMGTITAGEALTQSLAVTGYQGPVFVLTGQQDATFCGNGNRDPVLPDCLSGEDSRLGAVRALFPQASMFDFFAQPDSGHCHNMHYSAQQGFVAAHDFLARVVSGGGVSA